MRIITWMLVKVRSYTTAQGLTFKYQTSTMQLIKSKLIRLIFDIIMYHNYMESSQNIQMPINCTRNIITPGTKSGGATNKG